jgi:hypothetical protein
MGEQLLGQIEVRAWLGLHHGDHAPTQWVEFSYA